MKTIKKVITAMAAIAAAFTMFSCEKEQIIGPDGSIDAGDYIITAYTESSLTKTSLSGNDTQGYDVLWSEGDRISIGSSIFTLIDGEGTTQGTFRGTLPEDGTYTVCYPATYNGTDWPASQTYAANNITGSPMTAEVTVSGRKVAAPLSFKNAGGILRLTLKGTATVTLITVNVPGTGAFCLKCGGGVTLDNTNGKVFHIALPEGRSSEPLIQIKTVDGKTIDKRMKSGRELVIERSKITSVPISGINSTAPSGMLPGEFSVAEGRQVHFSRGNLRYTVNSGSWSFFDRQYDCGPSNYEDGHDKEISLFTWGYNAEKSINPYGNDGNNVSIKSGNFSQSDDWGSQVGNGVTWRTLTLAEWQYMLKTRNNASKKYGLATVCGIQGLIILPDEFDDPYTNGGSGSFKCQSSSPDWTDNVYTIGGDWEAMEYAGAVFLPMAGRRNGEEIIVTNSAFYWSSSAYDRFDAYFMHFGSYGYVESFNLHDRGYGSSVRLITEMCTVTFDMNGKTGTAPESRKIAQGSTITRPSPDPVVTDYVFTGWYKDQDCKTLWDFNSDVVTTNTTLYAGWDSLVLPAIFTVTNGRKVCFTKSNVWADGSNALHFERKPYEFSSSYDKNHVSHFSWSSSVNDAVGTTGSGDYLFCDENHKVSVDGSEPKYFALSLEDWTYMCYSRHVMYSHSNNITYNGQKGLVLYSDTYYGGDPLREDVNYTDETFPATDCVFIPYAGWRKNNTVNLVGKNGFYWTSTADSQTNAPYFVDSDYEEEYISFSLTGDPNDGMAIRLVTYAD